MKTPLLVLLAACASASTLTITSGRIEAGWGFGGEGGLSIGLSGDGFGMGARIDHNTSQFLIDCTVLCGISVSTVTFPGNTTNRGRAVVGNLTSTTFSLSFGTNGNDQWSGTLSLFDGMDAFGTPFATFDLTGFSIPTPPTWYVPNNLGVRDFNFTDAIATAGGGPVVASPSLTLDSPEPSALIPISIVLLLLNRHRARRQGRAA